jgi:hypothetical protein
LLEVFRFKHELKVFQIIACMDNVEKPVGSRKWLRHAIPWSEMDLSTIRSLSEMIWLREG